MSMQQIVILGIGSRSFGCLVQCMYDCEENVTYAVYFAGKLSEYNEPYKGV